MDRVDDRSGTIPVRRTVRFPVELTPPHGFDPGRSETWPQVDGLLEYVEGRLLYMPPCGDVQSDVVSDVLRILLRWQDAHAGYKVATNEAGIRLAGASRGADAAVFRRADLGDYTGGFRRVAPILAVEVAGQDEREPQLREKAAWYRRTHQGREQGCGHGQRLTAATRPSAAPMAVVSTGFDWLAQPLSQP